MSAKQLISIEGFIEKLRSFESGLITRDAVLELCGSIQISDSSLSPYVFFDDSFYTRNLVYRDDLFEVIIIGPAGAILQCRLRDLGAGVVVPVGLPVESRPHIGLVLLVLTYQRISM